MTLRFVSARRLGSAVAIVSLDAEEVFSYRSGQWILIEIPPEVSSKGEARDEPRTRPFSLASTPGELPRVEICARLRPGGLTSFWIESLRPGDPVRAERPRGKLLYEADRSSPLLFAATSVAIAPMRALIVEAEGAGHLRAPALLIHGVCAEGVLPYQDEMERIAGRCAGFDFDLRILERSLLDPRGTCPPIEQIESREARRETWQPLEEAALSWVDNLGERRSSLRVFLAGHGIFVNSLKSALRERFCVARESIRQEIFWP